mgnify:FL=1
MKPDKRKAIRIFCLLGIIPVVWLALLMAPAVSGGLPQIILQFPEAMNHPFDIRLCEDSLRTVLVFLSLYALALAIGFSNQHTYRRGEEHGSAKWGDVHELDKRYRDKDPFNNKPMTMHVQISLNPTQHYRNLLTTVVGGTGSGKSTRFAMQNLMQCNSSFVVLDPKGELLRTTGGLLEKQGYEIRVLDLLNMEKSHWFTPFVYIHSEADAQKMVTNFFKATTPKGGQSQDPFWDTSASMFLMSLVLLLHDKAPKEEQNFDMVMELLRAAEVREDDESYLSPLDELFERLEMEEPGHIALKYYNLYRKGAGKTLKSIQITLASRLEKFNLSELAKLTMTDELDLGSMGEKKVALFALIPDNDTSFNFLVSILYTQLFQQLFYLADHKYGGRLPVPVHFLMDEFANVSLPDDFEKILSVMRSRNVYVSIILQNIAQLKALFEKQWESILGNCDQFLYLGGNEQSTHKYVSELLGKATIDTNTYGKSTGRSGIYSTNYQNAGRELMTPDEVRMLNNKYAILFIRGERPILDEKLDMHKHPHVAQTTFGGAEPYRHGRTDLAMGEISVSRAATITPTDFTDAESQFELLSNEDIEEEFSI